MSSVAGLASVSLLPACIETAVEMTHPVSEATSGGLLLAGSNVIGTVYVLVITFVPDAVVSFFAVALASFVSIAALLLFKPVYVRLASETSLKTSLQ